MHTTIASCLTFIVSLNKKTLSDNSKFLSISYYLLGGNASPLCVNTVNCIDFYLLEPKWTNFLLNWLKWELECLNAKILVFIEIDSPTFILASLLNPNEIRHQQHLMTKYERGKKSIFFFLFFFFLAMNTKFTSLWAIVCTNRMLPFRLSISVAFNPFTILESNPHVVRIRYFLNTLNDGLERLHYHLWLWILMRMFVQKSEYVNNTASQTQYHIFSWGSY